MPKIDKTIADQIADDILQFGVTAAKLQLDQHECWEHDNQQACKQMKNNEDSWNLEASNLKTHLLNLEL